MAIRDRIYGLLEYILAFLFIRGGVIIFLFSEVPPNAPTFLTALVGSLAIDVYGLFFILVGVALLIAKWFNKRRLRKWSLLAMFLSCCYVFSLSTALSGISWGQWLTVVVGAVSAFLYLRWKLLTEYVSKDSLTQDS